MKLALHLLRLVRALTSDRTRSALENLALFGYFRDAGAFSVGTTRRRTTPDQTRALLTEQELLRRRLVIHNPKFIRCTP
jgi:hypothetical protein